MIDKVVVYSKRFQDWILINLKKPLSRNQPEWFKMLLLIVLGFAFVVLFCYIIGLIVLGLLKSIIGTIVLICLALIVWLTLSILLA